MAKRNVPPNSLANLKKFKPGNNANPLGAGAHDPVKKMLKRLTSEELKDIASLLLSGNVKELAHVRRSSSSSGIRAMVAGLALRAIRQGDANAFETLLARLMGKVENKVQLSGEVSTPIRNYMDMTEAERASIRAELEKRNPPKKG